MAFSQIKTTLIKESLSGGRSNVSLMREFQIFCTGDPVLATIFATPDDYGITAWGEDEDGLYLSNLDLEIKEDSPKNGGTTDLPVIVSAVATLSPDSSFTLGSGMPWERPAEWECVSGLDIKEAISFDMDGEWICNSAAEAYDPPQEAPVRGAKWRGTYNLEDDPAEAITNLRNTLNDAAFAGYDAGAVWLSDVSVKKLREIINGAEVVYFQVIVEIQFTTADYGWKLMPVDRGARYRGDGGKLVAYTDPEGNVADAVLLDGFGERLPEGDAPVIYPEAGYKMMAEADWSVIDLPEPF